jgi:hypothetical protein
MQPKLLSPNSQQWKLRTTRHILPLQAAATSLCLRACAGWAAAVSVSWLARQKSVADYGMRVFFGLWSTAACGWLHLVASIHCVWPASTCTCSSELRPETCKHALWQAYPLFVRHIHESLHRTNSCLVKHELKPRLRLHLGCSTWE